MKPKTVICRCVAGLVLLTFAPRPAQAYFNAQQCEYFCSDPTAQPVAQTPQPHPEVASFFWGTYWNAGFPSANEIVGAVQYILTGPYTSALTQYGLSPYSAAGEGVGPVRMAPGAPIESLANPLSPTVNPYGNPVAFAEMTNQINFMIGAGTLPPPNPGTNMLYTIFFPPDTEVTDYATDIGFNRPATCDNTCGMLYSGLPYTVMAVFPPSETQGGTKVATLAQYTRSFSHELAEATTNNVRVDCTGYHPQQIADVCQCYQETQMTNVAGSGAYHDDITVEAYWSQSAGACVIPDSWFHVYQYSGTPNSWFQIGSNVRQIAAGGAGLFATYADNSLQMFSGFLNSWIDTNLQGHIAMFAVGNTDVIGLPLSGPAGMPRYTGGAWTYASIPRPFTSVVSGVFDLATGIGGAPWQYQPSSNTWTLVGAPSDQFVVGSNWAASITMDHNDVRLLSPNSTSWTSTGMGAAELYIGGVRSLAARNLAEEIYAMTTTPANGVELPNPWQDVGSGMPMDSAALFGTSATPIAALSCDRSTIYSETAPIESGGPYSWSQISVGATRLVGQGGQLYATSGINFGYCCTGTNNTVAQSQLPCTTQQEDMSECTYVCCSTNGTIAKEPHYNCVNNGGSIVANSMCIGVPL